MIDAEFAAFQKLIYAEAGIHLSDAKRALLVARLNPRLRQLELDSFGRYLNRVREDPLERTRMLDCICTNETQFFREPGHFDWMATKLAPRWKDEVKRGLREPRIRVWSAACSTGEEPYSIAMCLLEHFSEWDVRVTASDLSTKVLDQAVRGVYPLSRASAIPPRYLKKYMLKGTRSREGFMRAGQALRDVVSFHQVNLNDDVYPLHGSFDLIFCRNVLIYFDTASKTRVVEKLLQRLSPGGYLFVGHAESLSTITERARAVIPTVYESGTRR